MQKGFTGVYMLIGIFILAVIVMIVPLPYFQKFDMFCFPCPPNQNCPTCPKAGWHLGTSLYKQIVTKYQSNIHQEELTRIVSPTPQPVLTDETANWKTYTNTDYSFSFQYPPSWNQKDVNDRGLGGIDVQGPEGNLYIVWGSGFGGGCDQQYHELVQLNQQNFDSCHIINPDGSESWRGIGKILSESVGVKITATAAASENHDLILQILSTFKFN